MQLDLRFLVPGPTETSTILLDGEGGLPAATSQTAWDEAAIVGVSTFLRDAWRFERPVLETYPRWDDLPDDAPVPTLVTTEPAAAGWTPPEGLAFAPIPPALPEGIPDRLVSRATELLAELRTGAPPPALRPRWSRAGWHDRASSWMTAALEAAGRPLVGPIRPFYLRGISALLRGPTSGGDVFLKAVFPPFHAEPVITARLAERFPASVPAVVAIEPDEGWLLVDDLDAPWIVSVPDDQQPHGLGLGARALVEIQRSLDEAALTAFTAAGCPSRPLDGIAAGLDEAIGPAGLAVVEGSATRDRADRAVEATRRAVDRVVDLGFPTSLVHGDFHSGNAAVVSDRAVIIDWSDAAIGWPAVDLATWLSWATGKPAIQQAAIDAWIEAWSGPTDPDAVRAAIDDIILVGAAYQVISYHGILAALEPATRYTMIGGGSHYLETLEKRIAPDQTS